MRRIVERVAIALYVSDGGHEECWPTLREDRASEYDEGPDKTEMRRMANAAIEALEFEEMRDSLTWAVKRLGELYAFYGCDDDENAAAYKKAQKVATPTAADPGEVPVGLVGSLRV